MSGRKLSTDSTRRLATPRTHFHRRFRAGYGRLRFSLAIDHRYAYTLVMATTNLTRTARALLRLSAEPDGITVTTWTPAGHVEAIHSLIQGGLVAEDVSLREPGWTITDRGRAVLLVCTAAAQLARVS